MGQSQTALWTLPLVATQYQPLQPTPAMQEALRAQNENRFLDAMILLDDAGRQADADTGAEINLLRASFLLQGNQSQQVLEILAPLLAQTKYAAGAYALTAMAYLQQGQMQKAPEAAQHARDAGDGALPHLALSYAYQGTGRLKEAREEMRGFNVQTPQALTLAREAELALTLDQVQAAKALLNQAEGMDAAHPYVIAVGGLIHLITGQSVPAKAAFETALRRDPKDAKALLGLGLAEIKLGNFQAGQKKLQAANEAEPGNALILTYLGRSQQQVGQTAEAMASWHSAQQADPKDPMPWLYQAQAELQANRLMEARASLRQAQARVAYRSVYRGANLLMEDEQLLAANLAESQRRSGQESLAFHSLSDPAGEKNSATLRNQADLLQGQRFGESARRSLLLQSQFNDRPGNLPEELDVYGDGAGETGASLPQHGAVTGLTAQQASYNNYDELFARRTTLEADAIKGSQNSTGEQVRLGVGNDKLGLNIAQRQYKTDGNAPFENLDNQIGQAVVQWRPLKSTQAFVSAQTFKSLRGETFYPADPIWLGSINQIEDNSRVTRVGLRHSLTDHSELRGLFSHQQADQTINLEFVCDTQPACPNFFMLLPFPQVTQLANSSVHGEELEYRDSETGHATRWGVQQTHSQMKGWYVPSSGGLTVYDYSIVRQQFYMAWQQELNPHWQLDAGLGWGKIENKDNYHPFTDNSRYLKDWLPKLGVVYTPDNATHVRFAAWQGMSFPGVGGATLAPVSLAGILLTRASDNSEPSGKLVKTVALGGDKQLSSAWLLEGEAQQRKTDFPSIEQTTLQQVMTRDQVDESKLALHWQPEKYPWLVSLAYAYERNQIDHTYTPLDSVIEQRLRSQQLGMRWFVSAQWTANLRWSRNQVEGMQHSLDFTFTETFPTYQESFNQVDAHLGYQFNRSGLLSFGVRNATDKRFQYKDTDTLNPRFSNGRLGYAKLKLAF